MFSLLGKDDYSPQKADNQSNVLDILHKAGVKVFWLDNNSTCKGACARVGLFFRGNYVRQTVQVNAFFS
jgi:lipid A ethanolaminephosphotransferase